MRRSVQASAAPRLLVAPGLLRVLAQAADKRVVRVHVRRLPEGGTRPTGGAVGAYELVREGREEGNVPSAEEVAIRAGLSRRTVFRLFEDMESLHIAACDHQRAEVLARFPAPLPLPLSLSRGLARNTNNTVDAVSSKATNLVFNKCDYRINDNCPPR